MNWNQAFAKRAELIRPSAIREMLKLAQRPEMISFTGGLPAPELFPVTEIEEALSQIVAKKSASALQYGETEGVRGLRARIAAEAGAGVENVLITTGAQQALDLIGRVLVDDGDEIAVENPTYPALLSAWRPLGARFREVETDEDGLIPQTIPRGAKILYTMPHFQNPQGTTLPLERRLELAALLKERSKILVEDDPYRELCYEGEPLPSVLGLSQGAGPLDGNVVFTGSFSKTLVPGLRVGWIVAPAPLIAKLAQAKHALDLHTPTFSQHLVLELLEHGTLLHQIPKLRMAYRTRRDAMLEGLQRHFAKDATWTRPRGGMFLMVRFREDVDAREVLAAALKEDVAFVPGAEFHLGNEGRNTLRLNFSHPKPDRIHEGVRRLAAAFGRVRAETCPAQKMDVLNAVK